MLFGRIFSVTPLAGEILVGKNGWMPRNASARLLSRPAICSCCNQMECPNGINCIDVRPEEVALAALETLCEQTYYQPTSYKGILGYKIESGLQEHLQLFNPPQ